MYLTNHDMALGTSNWESNRKRETEKEEENVGAQNVVTIDAVSFSMVRCFEQVISRLLKLQSMYK